MNMFFIIGSKKYTIHKLQYKINTLLIFIL